GDALRIGEEDTYVHGLNTYQITYTQRDVTRHYTDTDKDEFYWDVLGVECRVPIQQASVRLTVAPELKEAIKTVLQCYISVSGSTERFQAEEAEGAYLLTARDVSPYNGVTVALGFTPGTFAAYQMSTAEQLFRWWVMLTIITTVIGIGVIIWLAVRAHRLTYRSAELGTIVP